MEVTVKAVLKLKEQANAESPQKIPEIKSTLTMPQSGKRFSKEPVLMKDFIKSLGKDNLPT